LSPDLRNRNDWRRWFQLGLKETNKKKNPTLLLLFIKLSLFNGSVDLVGGDSFPSSGDWGWAAVQSVPGDGHLNPAQSFALPKVYTPLVDVFP